MFCIKLLQECSNLPGDGEHVFIAGFFNIDRDRRLPVVIGPVRIFRPAVFYHSNVLQAYQPSCLGGSYHNILNIRSIVPLGIRAYEQFLFSSLDNAACYPQICLADSSSHFIKPQTIGFQNIFTDTNLYFLFREPAQSNL